MTDGICEACPLDASLRAAEKLIHSAEGHTSREEALGGIALLRNSLEGVATTLACSQHVNNPEGQMVCPLADAANTTLQQAYGRWTEGRFSVPLHSVPTVNQSNPKETTTGQYL